MSPNKSLMVACGDVVVVVATHNAATASDLATACNAAAAGDVAALVGVVAADVVVVVVGVAVAVDVWVQQ